ncbi:MAG: EAL domain-containing protein [Phycisphaerales bacterium]
MLAKAKRNPFVWWVAQSNELIYADAPGALRPWRWAAGIAVLCVAPLILIALGIGFSTAAEPLSPQTVVGLSPAQLGEAAHRALRGSFTHTLLEWTALCAAAFVGILALVQYRLTREPSLPIIGMALVCAGAMDGFHTFAADRLISAVADNRNLIPFTWAICRFFNGAIMLVGVGIFAFFPKRQFSTRGNVFIVGISLCFVVAAYLIIQACATSDTLPQTMFPDATIKRPYDIYPLIPYLLCGLVVLPKYLKRHRTLFAYTLMLSLIPQVAVQLYMAFGSFRLHDSAFNIAHGLKVVSYGLPALGLLMGYVRTYYERWKAEEALRKTNDELEGRVVARTADLETHKKQLEAEIAQRMAAEAQLRRDALHDTLTGLSNRALLIEGLMRCIERAKRNHDYKFALLFLDLDRFKVINDSLGHAVGDQLLVGIARRLQRCVRSTDAVGRAEREAAVRLGGDEFVILLDTIEDAADASRVARRIQEEISEPFHLSGHDVATTVSIGIALSETGYDNAADMLRDADTAMYRAKEAGKARYAVFDTAMHAQAMCRLELENDLRRAIELQQFRLFYQPIVSLLTGRISGFEALVRWDHPQRGIVCPADFIPVAEETGLILPIDRWVLSEACQQLRQWRQQLPSAEALSINVNLSKRNVAEGGLVEEVGRVLRETGLPGASLRLEITETVIMEDPEFVSQILHELRALGVGLHMDDFGTGYSSLSYLHRFPFDVLKIDRAFVMTMQSNREYAAVVHAIITLAHNLNMKVTAEGIETPEQFAQILALDCDFGQGYLFSKPVTADQAAAIIDEKFIARKSA